MIHFNISISSRRVFEVVSSLEDVDVNALGYSYLISPMPSDTAIPVKSLITLVETISRFFRRSQMTE